MPFVEDSSLGEDVSGRVFAGLERSCEASGGSGIVSAPAYPGIERIQARFRGDAFDLHRHEPMRLA
jgi:hypothetical protein